MIKGIIKNLIGNASNILDEVITTKEEKLEAKKQIQQVLLDSELELEKNITERHKNDMKSDSWLSKNVRPLTLVFVIVCTMLLVFIDAGFINFNVKTEFVTLLSTTLVTIISFYFGSRGIEKIKK
tara:strand:+ start:2995 stop:3369 length:375 start_codon:yes stop_codon:yes gene_type:complete